MYVSKGVSREEWMWRGLAIAMCLAMVGLAVMPLAVGELGAAALIATYNPHSIWWWVGVGAEAMAVGATILSPPVGLAAQVLTGGSLL